MSELTVIVLAAGGGTRMKSKTPKVLHQIAGRSLVGHVMAAVSEAGLHLPTSRKVDARLAGVVAGIFRSVLGTEVPVAAGGG